MEFLKGKTALITGASKGIGLATAKSLAQTGCKVVLAARSAQIIEKEAELLRAQGFQALSLPCNVGDFQTMEQVVASTLNTMGSLDYLINNAGTIEPISSIANVDAQEWSKLIDVNIKGVFNTTRAALPHMLSRGGGTIINLSSGAANAPMEGWSAYCTSKAAVKMLTMCIHKEAFSEGVNVIGLSPGTVATGMMRQIQQSGINPVSRLDWKTHIPPEWVAKAIIYLCGPEGRKHSGTDFR